ncbi:MAG TPA: transglycosylase domain-containing protein, partial [Acidimicrobiales bacterium]|nr:transglycosylase domain-containing protein [Acidimicrobiales bacterium]
SGRPPWARRSLLWRARKVLFAMAFLLFTALAGTAYALSRAPLPPPFHQDLTTTLLDANGKPIAYLSGSTNRQPVPISEVPQVVVDAVVATEDHNFFHHHGVDPTGILRAAVNDLLGRGNLQGASTLTQQYVKNAYLGQQRTLARKVKEAMLALKLERTLTKQQILERYLNTIYFGRGAYGIQAASGAYFGKDVQTLTLPEAAFLAGVIRAPEYADPVRDPVTAKSRRDETLRDMAKYHKITETQALDAIATPLEADPYTPNNQKIAPDAQGIGVEYYVADVTRVLIQSVPGGEGAVYGTLTNQSGPAGALISVDTSGAIKAMVGGRDYGTSKVNLALGASGGGTGRQAGSTFKTVLLAQIVKDGYSVLSTYRAPDQITLPKADNGKDWVVSNFNDEDYSGGNGQGTLTLVDALRDSVNTVFAQAVMAEGPLRLAQMGDNLGLGPNLPGYASLVLGSVDQSVVQMAGAYATFMDNGTYIQPHTVLSVKNGTGQDITPQQEAPRQVLTRQQSDIVTYCLEQVVLSGTGTTARFGHQVAGKTGTTSNNTDAWFIGYTPQLTTAVWVGYPTGSTPMTNLYGFKQITGGTLPADIFRRFMVGALSGAPYARFDPPGSLDGTKGMLGQVPATFPTTTTTSTTTTSTTTTSTTSTTVAPPPSAPPPTARAG